MAQECCSGGMLVAMAADELYASRITIAGNIGVYMTAVSDAELYKKVGVELEYIATGGKQGARLSGIDGSSGEKSIGQWWRRASTSSRKPLRPHAV